MATRKNKKTAPAKTRTPQKTDDPADDGYFAYEGLDRVLHEKARLGILTALVTRPEGIAFVELKALCSLTDGNLARHLQTLSDAGCVDVEKLHPTGKRPTTTVFISKRGRAEFLAYLGELERVIEDARQTEDTAGAKSGRASKRGTRGRGPTGFAPA